LVQAASWAEFTAISLASLIANSLTSHSGHAELSRQAVCASNGPGFEGDQG